MTTKDTPGALGSNDQLGLSPHEQQAMALLAGDTRRDLYEGAAADGRSGSGNFWVTYTADEKYLPFANREVLTLLQRGLIVEKWPGWYTTPRNLAAHPLRA